VQVLDDSAGQLLTVLDIDIAVPVYVMEASSANYVKMPDGTGLCEL
jgi:hypothetical protein